MSNQIRKMRRRKERIKYAPKTNPAFVYERPLMGEKANDAWDKALNEYLQQFK
jgi:hypothetical protein